MSHAAVLQPSSMPGMYVMQAPMAEARPGVMATAGGHPSGMWLAQPQPQPQPQPQQVLLRPAAAGGGAMLQPAPQVVYAAGAQQPAMLLKAPAPQPVQQAPAMRLVQVPAHSMAQMAAPQAPQQVLLAQQQQQQPHVMLAGPGGVPGAAPDGAQGQQVYVNINGTLQRALLQNGSVYLLTNGAQAPRGPVMAAPPAAQRPALAPMPQPQQLQLAGGGGAPAGQVLVQAMLPDGRLVSAAPPASQGGPVVQVQAPQQLQLRPVVSAGQPQQASVMMMMQAPPGGLAQPGGAQPMYLAQQQPGAAPAPAGVPMQLRPQQPAPLPLQQLVPRGPAAQGPPRPAAQPQVVVGGAGVPVPPGHAPPANAALRPAMAAGAHLLVPGTSSVSASTASLLPRMAGPTELAPDAAGGAAAPGQYSGMQPPPQQQHAGLGAPGPNGELSSPPVPPVTPGMQPDPAAAGSAASSLLSLLSGAGAGAAGAPLAPAGASPPSPSHGVIGPQRKSGSGSRAPTPTPGGASPVVSAAGSQPGTPLRMGSAAAAAAGSLSNASSCGSLPAALAAVPGASAQGLADAAAAGGEGKAAIMRLMARSFIETGIPLEQALGMVQAADRELLTAAFEADAAATAAAALGQPLGAPQPGDAVVPPPASCGLALGGLGGVAISMPQRLSGLSLAAGSAQQAQFAGAGAGGADDARDAASGPDTFGGWGFSLFAGSGGASDLAARALDTFGGAAAAAKLPASAAPAPGLNDTDMASCLSALNL